MGKINKRKVAIIFGITGQDGSYLSKFLINKGYIVHGVKRRSSSFNTNRIDDIYEDIKSGKVKFADAAVQYSNCPSGQSGGSLGEFTEGMMVKAFEDVAFSLDVEQMSEPFESEFGFHIVKRDN